MLLHLFGEIKSGAEQNRRKEKRREEKRGEEKRGEEKRREGGKMKNGIPFEDCEDVRGNKKVP